MPKIIIRLPNQQDQKFRFTKNEILIGRGDECELVLPNVSVSRTHAAIRLDREGATIIDIGSENGIRIGGIEKKESRLQSGDEILIGSFSLVFLGDRQEDKFYRGRAVVYFPNYEPRHAQPTQEKTHKLSIKEAQRIIREKSILNSGCIVDDRGRKLFPEANPMTFGGKNAMVQTRGVWIRGSVALLQWNGKQHCIEKKGWWFSMNINGVAKKNAVLSNKDHIQIGRSVFTYVILDSIKSKR
jgi:hypothetical protein